MEASKLEYVVTSSSTSMSDMHITNRQTISDTFTLLAPYASGYVDFSVMTDWYQGSVTITVSSYTSHVYPKSSDIFYGATVKMPGPDVFIHLSEPDYEYWKRDTTSKAMQGSYTFVNGFANSKIMLSLSIVGRTNNPDISDYQYHLITPSWTITIWDG
jgi:hypothetical protein